MSSTLWLPKKKRRKKKRGIVVSPESIVCVCVSFFLLVQSPATAITLSTAGQLLNPKTTDGTPTAARDLWPLGEPLSHVSTRTLVSGVFVFFFCLFFFKINNSYGWISVRHVTFRSQLSKRGRSHGSPLLGVCLSLSFGFSLPLQVAMIFAVVSLSLAVGVRAPRHAAQENWRIWFWGIRQKHQACVASSLLLQNSGWHRGEDGVKKTSADPGEHVQRGSCFLGLII